MTFYTEGASSRVTGGAGADDFNHHTVFGVSFSQNLVITDFTTADTFSWAAEEDPNASPLGYLPEEVFDLFDSNDDDVISARDGSSTSPEGVGFSVTDTGPNLVLVIDEDSVTFNNVGRIAAADWA